MRIRTALVTARSAPAHERAIRTLMDWRVEVDEALFLGGLEQDTHATPQRSLFVQLVKR